MNTKPEWTYQDETNSKYIGILEFELGGGDSAYFEVIHTQDDKLVFGNTCNIGLLQSGYMELEGFSVDEGLQALLEELKTFYRDGIKGCNSIVVNKRM